MSSSRSSRPSRQDPEQLLVLQRAAGILNLSVDELLQLQRGPSSSTLTLGGGSSSSTHHGLNNVYVDNQQFASFPVNGSEDVFWDHGHSLNIDPLHQDVSHFAADFPSFTAQRPFLERHSSSGGVSHVLQHTPNEHVVLLNPEIENAWYACNKDYEWMDFDEISGSDRNNSSGTDGFVHLTPQSPGSDAESESTTRDDDVDMDSADEIDRSLSVTTPADARSGSSLGSRQYKLIAPRPGTVKSLSSGPTPVALGYRVRKKRAPYSQPHRADTNLTRALNACVRCRIQRNRVCTSLPKRSNMGPKSSTVYSGSHQPSRPLPVMPEQEG